MAQISTAVVAATGVSCAVWALVVVIARASLPYQLDYEEGNILNAAVRIVRGMTIYPPKREGNGERAAVF